MLIVSTLNYFTWRGGFIFCAFPFVTFSFAHAKGCKFIFLIIHIVLI